MAGSIAVHGPDGWPVPLPTESGGIRSHSIVLGIYKRTFCTPYVTYLMEWDAQSRTASRIFRPRILWIDDYRMSYRGDAVHVFGTYHGKRSFSGSA